MCRADMDKTSSIINFSVPMLPPLSISDVCDAIHDHDGREEVSLHLGKETKREMHRGEERRGEGGKLREEKTTKCRWGVCCCAQSCSSAFYPIGHSTCATAIRIRSTRGTPIVSHPTMIMSLPSPQS